ncbi:unnamed protein product [Prorocentrum cordatum]|uniref:Cyclin-dependent kinase 2 homolog n=1 Tax=Prorocentrum cordatum TaxID=2364126 RepID=A0ABN9UF61_9DINO|nr:unnamed protein product [Polarella glacialis]
MQEGGAAYGACPNSPEPPSVAACGVRRASRGGAAAEDEAAPTEAAAPPELGRSPLFLRPSVGTWLALRPMQATHAAAGCGACAIGTAPLTAPLHESSRVGQAAEAPREGQDEANLDVASEHFCHYVGGLGRDMIDGEKAVRHVEGVHNDEASTDAGSSFAASPASGGHDLESPGRHGPERYVPLAEIGRGVYGTVLVARDCETNETVALKRIVMDDDQGDGVPAHVIREVSLLRDFSHRHVVQLRDIQVLSLTEFQLVFEYVPDELHRVLKGHRRAGTQLPMARVLQYSQEFLGGRASLGEWGREGKATRGLWMQWEG